MSRRRGLTRLVDPWAALLLGVLVALGVVILLATPGPWHRVVGPARVQLVQPPARDIALYVRAAAPRGRCTTVAWLHFEYGVPSLTVVLVPPETQVPVAGGGFAPVGRLVSDVGAAAATAGLAEGLQTPLGGWVTIDRQALRLVLSAARAPGPDRLGLPAFREAVAALRRTPLALPALVAQQHVLTHTLPAIPFDLLNQVAIVNYVLGSAQVDSDLDLRAASTIVRTIQKMTAGSVAVRTLPVIVERCGAATAWRPDTARAERLRLSLAYGLTPPGTAPQLTSRRRAAEIVVAAPAGSPATEFAQALRRDLRRQAAGPVGVTVEPLPASADAVSSLLAVVTRRRPLAVVVAPTLRLAAPASASASASPTPSPSAGDAQSALLTGLAAAWQPTIVLAEAPGDVTVTGDRIAPAPVVAVSGTTSGGETITPVAQAGRAADALVRSCWPVYLAPGLEGTRLDFTYAARQAVTLAVLSGGSPLDLALSARLAASGYALRALGIDAWKAPAGGSLIGYGPGMARAAQVLQGDVEALLGRRPHRRASLPLFAADDGPEPLTLVLAQ